MADTTPKTYSNDPELYLYTSLTSGSSHIVTATSRMETILKANRIPFKALDIATDEKARMLWGRRAGKDESGRPRKIPGLVQMGLVIGDLVEVEDWNEYGELKQHVKIVGNSNMTPVRSTAPTPSGTPSKAPVLQENIKPETATAGSSKTVEPSKPAAESAPSSIALALRQAGQEAAQKAKDGKKKAPVEIFDGVGEAEPVKKDLEKSATIPPPIAILDPSTEKRTVQTKTSLQSPTSTAWRKGAPDGNITTARRRSIEILESMQSPNSTAWKPTDVDPPILTHRGSSISLASAEEIRQIEEECKIDEVDEEDEEEEDDDDDDDDDDDEDEDEDEDEEEEEEEEDSDKKKAGKD